MYKELNILQGKIGQHLQKHEQEKGECFGWTNQRDAMETRIQLEDLFEDDDEPTSSRIGSDEMKSDMAGLSDQFEQVKGFLLQENWRKNMYALVLVKNIVKDPSILSYFECRTWITVCRKLIFNQICLELQRK